MIPKLFFFFLSSFKHCFMKFAKKEKCRTWPFFALNHAIILMISPEFSSEAAVFCGHGTSASMASPEKPSPRNIKWDISSHHVLFIWGWVKTLYPW